MKITYFGEHKLHKWVIGNTEVVPALQAILERTSSGIVTQLPMDRIYMISKNKFKCCSYYLMAIHNVFKCVCDISPISTWSTWQTMMVYTTQMLLWLNKYFHFHLSRRKTKTENFCGFPVSVREVCLRTGNTAKLFCSRELTKSHHRFVKEEQWMFGRDFWKSYSLTTYSKKSQFRSGYSGLIPAEFWISSGTDIARPHWAYCSNIWLPLVGDVFLIPAWKFYTCELSPWTLAHCAPLGRVWLSLHYIVFS